MNAKEAVARRIEQLCRQRRMTIHEVAMRAGMSASTVYSTLNRKSLNPGVITIQMICEGFGITVRAFFDDPLFDNLELSEDE